MKNHLHPSTWTAVILLFITTCSFAQPTHPEKHKYVDIDGARLFVRLVGSGEPLLILHGGPGMSHDYLAPQFIDLLANEYQLIFYDQRASGRSTGVEDTSRLTILQFTDDLEILRQQLELNRVNLLGHSFGGLLAMYYAFSYPENVNKLLLIETSPASWELNFPHFRKTIAERQTESDRQELSILRSRNDFKTNPELVDRYFKLYFKPFFKDSSLIRQLSLGIDNDWGSKFYLTNDRIWKSLGRYDIHDQLNIINAPTLIMHCEFSVLAVAGAQEIERMIPNSTLVIMEGVGHFPYIEDPTAFYRTISTFLREDQD